jgi:type I restriction enzyme, R subunit
MTVDPTEAEVRKSRIDPKLAEVGWSLRELSLLEELLLSDSLPSSMSGTPANPERADREFVDYALLGRDRTPLAIVEAKRSARDPLAGKRQAADYADRIRSLYGFDPFIFLTNGETLWFWDREQYPPRLVTGFFTQEDLERLTCNIEESVKSKLEGLMEVRAERIGGNENYVISVSYLQFALENSAELETLVQAIDNYRGTS